jgi:hypothetical protein
LLNFCKRRALKIRPNSVRAVKCGFHAPTPGTPFMPPHRSSSKVPRRKPYVGLLRHTSRRERRQHPKAYQFCSWHRAPWSLPPIRLKSNLAPTSSECLLLAQSGHRDAAPQMSAFGGKADINPRCPNVRF